MAITCKKIFGTYFNIPEDLEPNGQDLILESKFDDKVARFDPVKGKKYSFLVKDQSGDYFLYHGTSKIMDFIEITKSHEIIFASPRIQKEWLFLNESQVNRFLDRMNQAWKN